MARRAGARTQENKKIVKCKVKNIPWDIHTVKSTYDQSLDDYLLDGIEWTGKSVNLSSKTNNEQVMNEMKLSKRVYKAFISTNEIFICFIKNNEPCFCLKRN